MKRDFSIGFRDGLQGLAYNTGSNSEAYNAGFRRGQLQRRAERAMTTAVMVGMGTILAIGWFV